MLSIDPLILTNLQFFNVIPKPKNQNLAWQKNATNKFLTTKKDIFILTAESFCYYFINLLEMLCNCLIAAITI